MMTGVTGGGHNVVILVPFRGKAGLERFWEKPYLGHCLVSLYTLASVGRATYLAGVLGGLRLSFYDIMLTFWVF